MRTAAPATGRANRALGKSVAKNRPAPPATSAVRAPRTFPRRPAAPAAPCNSMSQCYIHVSSIANHPKFNRKPRRLESIVSRTKQTPATQINRQLSATSCNTHRDASNHHNRLSAPALTCRLLLVTHHCLSNRQWQILEFTVTHTKQTTAPRSNRHFFAISASRLRWQECGSREPGNAILLNGDLLERQSGDWRSWELRLAADGAGAGAHRERGLYDDRIGKARVGRRGDSLQQGFRGDHAHFAERLADGGERGILVGGAGDVVEADDGNVLGNF